jgi:hypothetical protein
MKILSPLDLTGQRLFNLGDPTVATDAVNKQYVDNFVQGQSGKGEVRAASTGNVSLAAPGASLDGVALVSGDRILLKDQTAQAENGIYVWTGSAAALTRSTDMNTAAEFKSALVPVAEGSTNANKMFLQTADAITLGTTAITFVSFGTNTSYVAGNGINITGSTLSVVADAGKGVNVGAAGLSLDTTYVVRKYAANIGGATTATVTHNLNTRDVTWAIYDAATFADILADVVRTDANNLTVTFAVAPAANAYRIVVHA